MALAGPVRFVVVVRLMSCAHSEFVVRTASWRGGMAMTQS